MIAVIELPLRLPLRLIRGPVSEDVKDMLPSENFADSHFAPVVAKELLLLRFNMSGTPGML